MKHKKKYSLVLFFALATIGFLMIQPLEHKKMAKSSAQAKKPAEKKPAKAKRAPASILPAKKLTIVTNEGDAREVIGQKIKDPSELRFENKPQKNWQEIYTRKFKRLTQNAEIKDFKIELKKSVVKVKNKVGRNMEHVKVSYTRPGLGPFSFEAMIDSETGSMIHSWNQTEYEFEKPLKLTGRILQRD